MAKYPPPIVLTPPPGIDLRIDSESYEDVVRRQRAKEPNCSHCGERKPADPHLHHMCPGMMWKVGSNG